MSAAALQERLDATVRELVSPDMNSYHLGRITRELTQARLSLQLAFLHARGNPQAEQLLRDAGVQLRTVLDRFKAACEGGRL